MRKSMLRCAEPCSKGRLSLFFGGFVSDGMASCCCTWHVDIIRAGNVDFIKFLHVN